MIFQDPVRVAEPGEDDPPPPRAAAAHPQDRPAEPGRRARPRAPPHGRPGAARGDRRQVPARALGRAAPARRDRAGARGRAEGRARGRADQHARRLDPDRDPEPDARPEGGARPRLPVRHPRPRRPRATSPTTSSSCTPARSSSSGPVEQVLAEPLHPYTQLLLSRRTRPGGRAEGEADRGAARPRLRRRGRPAGGLPIRRPLPARDRRLLARSRPTWSRRVPDRPARCHVNAPSTSDREDQPCLPTTATLLSRRLRLGYRDRRVPDRGRRPRGRPRREHLGPLRRDAGEGAGRRHRRDRVRLLPPLPRRHRADARARRRRLPLLDRVAADPARGARARERGRARLLRPPGRRAPRSRDRAVPDAVPLGSPAGARGRGRLAEPGDRRGVRGAHRARRRPPGRPDHALDDAQRAVRRLLDRLRVGRARARPRLAARSPRRRAHGAASRTAWPPR